MTARLDRSRPFWLNDPLRLVEDIIDRDGCETGWRVTASLAAHRERPVISALLIESADPDGWQPLGGIKGETLRQISIPRLIADGVREIEELRSEGVSGKLIASGGGFDYDPPRTTFRHAGRRGNGDLHYAEWARRYLEVVAAGSRRPIADLASLRDLRRSKDPRAYVRDTVQEARRRDLLTVVGRGKIGGELTARARALLSNQDQEG